MRLARAIQRNGLKSKTITLTRKMNDSMLSDPRAFTINTSLWLPSSQSRANELGQRHLERKTRRQGLFGQGLVASARADQADRREPAAHPAGHHRRARRQIPRRAGAPIR